MPTPNTVAPHIRARYAKLADLDESVWNSLTREECNACGNAIVSYIALQRSSPLLEQIRFPPLPESLTLDMLELSLRTFNSLNNALESGTIPAPSHWKELTASNFLSEISGFGIRSLVDLLASLETFRTSSDANLKRINENALPSQALTRWAERLRDMRVAGTIRCNDPRLRQYLEPIVDYANAVTREPRLPPSSHLYAVAHRLVGREFDTNPDDAVSLIQRARRAISARLKITLDKELLQLVGTVVDSRRGNIFMQYCGWDGGGTSTLQAVGDKNSITRERVRQIVTPIADSLRRSKPFTPILDRVLVVLNRRLPVTESEACRLLRRRGLISGTFLLDGAINAAETFGLSAGLALEGTKDARTLVRSDQIGLSRLISRLARSAVSHFGISTVADLCSRLSDLTGHDADDRFVSALLQKYDGYRALDKHNTWFWLDNLKRNHLITLVRKVFTVAPRVHVSELRAAISADPRGMGYAPPSEIVIEFCRQACTCEALSQIVTCGETLNPSSTLSPAEMIQFDVLRERGPLLSRYDFERECCSRGMNQTTFSIYLGRSPIVARYAESLYGLR
ncbi:MAG: hypothetical protein WAK26_15680, partial [Terracidiphilus sp.]